LKLPKIICTRLQGRGTVWNARFGTVIWLQIEKVTFVLLNFLCPCDLPKTLSELEDLHDTARQKKQRTSRWSIQK
jgi:hypothetical protein